MQFKDKPPVFYGRISIRKSYGFVDRSNPKNVYASNFTVVTERPCHDQFSGFCHTDDIGSMSFLKSLNFGRAPGGPEWPAPEKAKVKDHLPTGLL